MNLGNSLWIWEISFEFGKFSSNSVNLLVCLCNLYNSKKIDLKCQWNGELLVKMYKYAPMMNKKLFLLWKLMVRMIEPTIWVDSRNPWKVIEYILKCRSFYFRGHWVHWKSEKTLKTTKNRHTTIDVKKCIGNEDFWWKFSEFLINMHSVRDESLDSILWIIDLNCCRKWIFLMEILEISCQSVLVEMSHRSFISVGIEDFGWKFSEFLINTHVVRLLITTIEPLRRPSAAFATGCFCCKFSILIHLMHDVLNELIHTYEYS